MLEFVPVPREALRSEAYLGSEPVDRATWLALLAYSFGQLSGGRLEGAAAWKNRKLEQLLGITREELERGYRPELEADSACGKPCGKVAENPVEKLRKTEKANSTGGHSPTYGLALWALIGDDVIVKFYPYESEKRIVASRRNGRKGGRPKGS